jgi:potassium efflux system protein
MTNLQIYKYLTSLGEFMLDSLNEFFVPLTHFWNHKLLTLAGIKLSVGNLTMALTMLVFASKLSKLTTRAIERRLIIPFVDDKSSQNTYKTFAFYGSLALFVTLSLAIAGIPLSVFTVFGGALAIGVGFGSQNIVNNFISGIILLVERPIKVGDIVELENISGSVISIGTRSTQVKNAEGKIFVVPNSFFLEKSVLNWSYERSVVRTSVKFGVAYGSNLKLVENICTDILLNTEHILQDPLPIVLFDNFSESNLDFELLFWCDLKEVSTLSEVRSAVRFKIDERLRLHKIEMSFPQRELHLKLSRPVEINLLNSKNENLSP